MTVMLILAGILLCGGFIIMLVNQRWSKGEKQPGTAGNKLLVSGNQKNENIANLYETIQSINGSLNRLQSINNQIHEQNEALIKLSDTFSRRRDFRPETPYKFPAAFPSGQPAASPARPPSRPPIPFSSSPSSSFFGKNKTLSEAEIVAIHLNQIKMNQEFRYFRDADDTDPLH
jgi:hypothetical protein